MKGGNDPTNDVEFVSSYGMRGKALGLKSHVLLRVISRMLMRTSWKKEGFARNSIVMYLEFANRLFHIISQIGEAAKKLKRAYNQDTHQKDDLQPIYQILPPPKQDLKIAGSSYARDFQTGPSNSMAKSSFHSITMDVGGW